MDNLYGFLSYAHIDDQNDHNRISYLAEHIKNEYRLLTGNAVDIFVDVKLLWGDDWKKKIEDQLARTVFFIAVITPNYLNSSSCIEEILYFKDKAEQLGSDRLFLPILYTDIPSLHDEADQSKMITLIRKYQYEDWRVVRLEDFQSKNYRSAINGLTNRLVQVNSEMNILSTNPISSTESRRTLINSKEGSSPDDRSCSSNEELGTIEKIAMYEKTLPEMTQTMNEISDHISALGSIGAKRAKEIEEMVPQPSYAQRAEMLKETSREYWDPIQSIKNLTTQFVQQINDVDTGFRELLNQFAAQIAANEIEDEVPSILDLFLSIESMQKSSKESREALVGMIDSFTPLEKLSREMRIVLGVLSENLSILIESMKIVDTWTAPITDIKNQIL